MAEDQEQEKTEDATPRHQQEAREKGQVPFSSEIVSAIMLVAGTAILTGVGGKIVGLAGALVADVTSSMAYLGTQELTVSDYSVLLQSSVRGALPGLALLTIPMLVIGVVAGYGQIGFLITPKALEFDPNKINPFKGFGRLFSMRAVVRTGLAILKIAMIGAVVVTIAWRHVPDTATFSGQEIGPVMRGIGKVYLRSTIGGLFVILVLALVDLMYQRYQHEKDLRMSKQEIKEESKSMDGDPHMRARVRQIQREMASQRMMSEVPEATVVITNPTHFAVALKYDQVSGTSETPRVVAKGMDHLALRIKLRAKESNVLCYEDVALARALYAQVDVGQEIPEDLFESVAAVLAYVFKLQGAVKPATTEAAR